MTTSHKPHEEKHPTGDAGHAHDHGHGEHHEGCRRYIATLSDYVDGALDDELCRELEAHMETCENCRVVVNTLNKTVTLYHRLPSPEMPNAVKERLYKVLDIGQFYHPAEHAADESALASEE